ATDSAADTAARVAAAPAAESAAAPAGAGGWVTLFDGTSLDRWRGYKRHDIPASWRIVDGTLAHMDTGKQPDRGDIVSRDQYGDFELEYEWKIQPGGNSGVMWHVSEDQAFPYETGPEAQILDNERHADGKIPSHHAGALYDLVVPPDRVTRPVGEFNTARIVSRGSRVQLFLNGTQTADFDFASAAGKAALAKSKFAKMPGFARNSTGHIDLQDHGDTVYFRNIRIRPLGAAAPGGE
ncbi:MAG TPA: DUF1080 domain-containing protein, partial [Longimicrobiaceae bacterium]